MKANIGKADKVIRIILAGLFGVLYGMKIITGTFGIALVVLGVVFLLTSVINFCPIYAIFKMKTNK